MKKIFLLLVIPIGALTAFNRIKNVNKEITVLAISSISPSNGPYNTVVTINGSGFSNKLEENIVQINGINIPVQGASSKELTITIPKGVASGNMIVTVRGETVEGPVFTYEYTTTVSTLPKLRSLFNTSTTTSTQSYFTNPKYIARDKDGNLYVTDGNCIKVMEVGGHVRTLAGSNEAGYVDGASSTARFNDPRGIAVDANGNVFVADYGNQKLRKITPVGLTSSIIISAIVDPLGDKRQVQACLAIDKFGSLYLGMIGRVITSSLTNGQLYKTEVCPFVTQIGSASQQYNLFECLMTSAYGGGLSGMALDVSGFMYVARSSSETLGSYVYKIGDNRVLSRWWIIGPQGVAVDSKGNVYVANGDNRIRMISPDGSVSTVAGTGVAGYLDGSGASSQFNRPMGITVDNFGNIMVADNGNNKVRMITRE